MLPHACPELDPILPSPVTDPAQAAPRRLLLVEDDPLQARGLLRLLDSLGITCHNVPSAAAALEAIASQPPYDVIVADLGLPGLSGAELARRLRRPLLIAYSGGPDRPPHFDAHVEKPRIGELLRLIDARRLSLVTLMLCAGECLGHATERGLFCHASSPAHALRILATAIESGL